MMGKVVGWTLTRIFRCSDFLVERVMLSPFVQIPFMEMASKDAGHKWVALVLPAFGW